MLVYQAVAEYLTTTKEGVDNGDLLNVNVILFNSRKDSYQLNRQSSYYISRMQVRTNRCHATSPGVRQFLKFSSSHRGAFFSSGVRFLRTLPPFVIDG